MTQPTLMHWYAQLKIIKLFHSLGLNESQLSSGMLSRTYSQADTSEEPRALESISEKVVQAQYCI